MNAEYFSGVLGKVNDKYIMEAITYRKKKKGDWLKWGAVAACLGLIFTAAMMVLPGILSGRDAVVPPADSDVSGLMADKGDSQPGGEGIQPGIEPVQPGKDDSQSGIEPLQPSGEQEIVIDWDNVAVNESAGMADSALRYYDPSLYDKENWGEEEIVAYYGWNLAPDYIPDGLTSGNGPRGAMYREKATGEIVQEQVGRGFWTDFYEDGSPKSDDDLYIPTGFDIRASRLSILRCGLLLPDEIRVNDFGGVSVILTHCSMKHGPYDRTQRAPDGLSYMPAGYYDIYVASFTMNGVEYEIETQRLELEEVVKIVVSVIGRLSKEV